MCDQISTRNLHSIIIEATKDDATVCIVNYYLKKKRKNERKKNWNKNERHILDKYV